MVPRILRPFNSWDSSCGIWKSFIDHMAMKNDNTPIPIKIHIIDFSILLGIPSLRDLTQIVYQTLLTIRWRVYRKKIIASSLWFDL